MDVGSAAEWFSGLGSLAAAIVALRVARNAQAMAREDRRAAVRDRIAVRLVELIKAVENDIDESEHLHRLVRSKAAAAQCRALWSQRNWFGTTWHVYCDDDQTWPDDLYRTGELFPRMRAELLEALSRLEHEEAPHRGALDRALGKVGLQRTA